MSRGSTRNIFAMVGVVVACVASYPTLAASCDQYPPQDRDTCLSLVQADQNLNATYRQAMDSAGEPEKVTLRGQQRAWLKARDAACNIVYRGSDRDAWFAFLLEDRVRAECVIYETTARNARLQSALIFAMPRAQPAPTVAQPTPQYVAQAEKAPPGRRSLPRGIWLESYNVDDLFVYNPHPLIDNNGKTTESIQWFGPSTAMRGHFKPPYDGDIVRRYRLPGQESTASEYVPDGTGILIFRDNGKASAILLARFSRGQWLDYVQKSTSGNGAPVAYIVDGGVHNRTNDIRQVIGRMSAIPDAHVNKALDSARYEDDPEKIRAFISTLNTELRQVVNAEAEGRAQAERERVAEAGRKRSIAEAELASFQGRWYDAELNSKLYVDGANANPSSSDMKSCNYQGIVPFSSHQHALSIENYRMKERLDPNLMSSLFAESTSGASFQCSNGSIIIARSNRPNIAIAIESGNSAVGAKAYLLRKMDSVTCRNCMEDSTCIDGSCLEPGAYGTQLIRPRGGYRCYRAFSGKFGGEYGNPEKGVTFFWNDARCSFGMTTDRNNPSDVLPDIALGQPTKFVGTFYLTDSEIKDDNPNCDGSSHSTAFCGQARGGPRYGRLYFSDGRVVEGGLVLDYALKGSRSKGWVFAAGKTPKSNKDQLQAALFGLSAVGSVAIIEGINSIATAIACSSAPEACRNGRIIGGATSYSSPNNANTSSGESGKAGGQFGSSSSSPSGTQSSGAGRIRGSVRFTSGSPCAGCDVFLHIDGGSDRTTTTASDGSYSVSTSSCTIGVEAHVRGTKVMGNRVMNTCPVAELNLTVSP